MYTQTHLRTPIESALNVKKKKWELVASSPKMVNTRNAWAILTLYALWVFDVVRFSILFIDFLSVAFALVLSVSFHHLWIGFYSHLYRIHYLDFCFCRELIAAKHRPKKRYCKLFVRCCCRISPVWTTDECSTFKHFRIKCNACWGGTHEIHTQHRHDERAESSFTHGLYTKKSETDCHCFKTKRYECFSKAKLTNKWFDTRISNLVYVKFKWKIWHTHKTFAFYSLAIRCFSRCNEKE